MRARLILAACALNALAQAPAEPALTSSRGHTVGEEKVAYIFKLNAARRRWGPMFDAVAGATLVIAESGQLADADRSGIVVAALLGSPDNNVVDMTDLVLTVGDAIAGSERAIVARMIGRGRPRAPDLTWAVAGRMVEIVRRVRGLDDATVGRVVEVIRLIGEHPLMLGLPG